MAAGIQPHSGYRDVHSSPEERQQDHRRAAIPLEPLYPKNQRASSKQNRGRPPQLDTGIHSWLGRRRRAPPAVEYFTKKESGGNFLTILFGHTADPVFHALGGLEELSALLTTRWPETKLLHADGSFDRLIKRETPDHVMLQGTLKNNGAPISMTARSGKGFKDSPNLVWRIFGTKGEIRLTSAAMLTLALGGEKIEVFDHEKDTVEVVNVEYAEAVKDLSPFAKDIGMLYEGFVNGWGVEEGFVDFEQAVGMHTIIDCMEKSSEERKYRKIAV